MIACASFLGENARPIYERIVEYTAARSGRPARLLPPMDWAELHRQLDAGLIQVAFLCGLPYVEKHDRPGSSLALLAAPVMRAERYAGRPIYFTDVIVRRDSPWDTFDALRGCVWAYNGNDSNSGYNMPRDYLLSRGETSGFFGRTLESGSHQRSIELVLDGGADASGIDSVVLEMEMHLRPELEQQLRVIEAIGPCPIPPVVAAGRLPAEARARLRQTLLRMHEDEQGATILQAGLMARFVEVDDSYYDPIREMVRRAERAGFVVM